MEENAKISLEKAKEFLRQDGIEVDLEQARIIRDFLYEMAEIVADNHLSKNKIV